MDALAGIKTRIKKKHDCKNTCDIKQQYIGPRLPASKWTGCAHRMWPKFDKKWKYIDKPRKSNGNYDVRRLTYVIEQGLLYSKNFGLRYSFEFYLMSTGEQSRLYVKNIHNNNLIKRLTISVLLATPSKIWSKLQLSLNSRPLLVFIWLFWHGRLLTSEVSRSFLNIFSNFQNCHHHVCLLVFKAWQTANSQIKSAIDLAKTETGFLSGKFSNPFSRAWKYVFGHVILQNMAVSVYNRALPLMRTITSAPCRKLSVISCSSKCTYFCHRFIYIDTNLNLRVVIGCVSCILMESAYVFHAAFGHASFPFFRNMVRIRIRIGIISQQGPKRVHHTDEL